MTPSWTAASSDRVAARNAATDIAEAMLDLRERIVWDVPPHRALQCHPTLNVGVTAQAGVYYGVLPGEAAFGCDLRTVPGMTEHAVHEALERWRTTAQTAGGRAIDLDIVYQPELSWIPSSEIATDHPLVRAAQQASEAVLGQSISLSVFPGATDARGTTRRASRRSRLSAPAPSPIAIIVNNLDLRAGEQKPVGNAGVSGTAISSLARLPRASVPLGGRIRSAGPRRLVRRGRLAPRPLTSCGET